MFDVQDTAVGVQPQHPTSTTFNAAEAIEQHMPLAEGIARQMYWRCSRFHDLDDLTGYAYLGLVRAARRYTMSEAVDAKVFSEYADKLISDVVRRGAYGMSNIHFHHSRMIKRGQMAKPTIRRGLSAWEADHAMTFDRRHWDESDKPTLTEMLSWLRQQDACLAEIVELHVKDGLTMTEVGQRTGCSRATVTRHYARAVNELTRRFNPAGFRPYGTGPEGVRVQNQPRSRRQRSRESTRHRMVV